MIGIAPPRPAHWWPTLALIAAVGFALRLAAAHGGLWLDEAWSASYARDVITPVGVFARIHHDNNHHLNTLWLQLAGFDAPTPVQRGLAIVSGTVAIVVAGLIGARRGVGAGIVTALLFAVSPILVTYGSEARGYAPMILCLMIAFALVDRWLDARATASSAPPPVVGLAAICLLGMLAQLTMALGVGAISLWAGFRIWRESGLRIALTDGCRIIGPSLAVTAVMAIAIIVILPGRNGFLFGNYEAFTPGRFIAGLHQMISYSCGVASVWPKPTIMLPAVALTATVVSLAVVSSTRPRAGFYAIAIIGLPLAIALARVGNAGVARYYLLGAVALLLLAGEVAGRAIERGGPVRMAAIVAGGGMLICSGWSDAALVANRRADPAGAIRAMAAHAPAGTTVSTDRVRAGPVLEAAAATAHYPLASDACGRFLFIDRDGDEPFAATPHLCGANYRMIATASPTGLSGTHWRLYERLPSS